MPKGGMTNGECQMGAGSQSRSNISRISLDVKWQTLILEQRIENKNTFAEFSLFSDDPPTPERRFEIKGEIRKQPTNRK
jgi:hypothetical protein